MAVWIEKEFSTAQTYEWDSAGDAFRTIYLLPIGVGNVTYNIEVSNGGDVWFQHPGATNTNPVSNTPTRVAHNCVWQKTRVRITTAEIPLSLAYFATHLDR